MHLAERLGDAPDTELPALHSADMGWREPANLATFELMEFGRVTSGSVIMPARTSGRSPTTGAGLFRDRAPKPRRGLA